MEEKLSKTRITLMAVSIATAYCVWGILLSLQPPFYPLEAEKKGASPKQYGFVFGIAHLAAFLTAPFFGKWGAKIGPKFLYNTGAYVQAICGVSFGFLTYVEDPDTFIWLSYLLRALGGISDAAAWGSVLSILMKLFPKKVTTIMSWTETFFGAGCILGPAVGSVLYNVGGFQLPFLVVGSVAVIVANIMVLVIPNAKPDPVKKSSAKSLTFIDILVSPTMFVPFLDLLVYFFGYGMIVSMLEPHMADVGASPTQTGVTFLIFGTVYTISTPLFGIVSPLASSSSEDDDAKEKAFQQPRRRPPRSRGGNSRKISTPTAIDASNFGMTNLEKLIRTHPIWFLPKVQREEANSLLEAKSEGAFIVRQSKQQENTMALSVRLKDDLGIEHYLILQQEHEPTKLRLESSEHCFENVLSLVYHYATTMDELPVLLSLPASLRNADSRQTLSSMALLGKDFWKYPMSNGESSLSSGEGRGKMTTTTTTNKFLDPGTPTRMRKTSEPLCQEARATLEETLCGLQKVSDMLQASLVDLENKRLATPPPLPSAPVPPPRTSSSPHATPPTRIRRSSDTRFPLENSSTNRLQSPPAQRRPTRHSVCKMVVSQIPATRFPTTHSPPRSYSPPLKASVVQNNNNESFLSPGEKANDDDQEDKKNMDATEMLLSNQPIVELRSKLSEEMFGTNLSDPKQWYTYYRSSISERMSDYEDIWEQKQQNTTDLDLERCITPAESEIQFKAYIAQKLHNELPSTSPSSNVTTISSVASTASTASTTSSVFMTSSTATSNMEDDSFGEKSGLESSEPIYSDPLDALENADDTKIYHCPEFSEDVVIYEEPPPRSSDKPVPLPTLEENGEKVQTQQQPDDSNQVPRRKRAVSTTHAPQVILIDDKKALKRRSHSHVMQSKIDLGSTQNRLSSVIGKYIRPLSKQAWQIDSSSWEFLVHEENQENNKSTSNDNNGKEQDDNSEASNGDHFLTVVENQNNQTDSGLELEQSQTLNSLQTVSSGAINGQDSLTSQPPSEERATSANDEPKTNEAEVVETRNDRTKGQLAASRRVIREYVVDVLADPSSDFTLAKMVTQFIDCTQRSMAARGPVEVVLRNIRQFMNGLKNYLIRQGEGDLSSIINAQRSKLNPDEFLNVDSLLEEAMHTLILRPLTSHLREHIFVAQSEANKTKSTTTTSSASPTFETDIAISRATQVAFRQCCSQMKDAFSPLDKLAHLLTATRVVVNSVQDRIETVDAERFCGLLASLLSEDDDSPTPKGGEKRESLASNVEIDLELMWSLLPKSVLKGISNGEAAFNLTLMSSAVNLVREQSNATAGSLNRDGVNRVQPAAVNTGKSWSSYGTTNSFEGGPGLSSFRLRVFHIPDNLSSAGGLGTGGGDQLVCKTVPLRNEKSKAKDVCDLLAHMLKVQNPEDFGLFSVVDGEETALSDSSQPLLVLDEARLRGAQFCGFAFRRRDAQIAWPPHLGTDLRCTSPQPS